MTTRKSSTFAVSHALPRAVPAPTAPGLVIRGEAFTVHTTERVELVDLTDRIAAFVARTGIGEGMVNLWAMHTTCALLINENQAALLSDIKVEFEKLVARDGRWLHNDPAHSDCDRLNADSHLKAMLVGYGQTLQIAGGEVVLGQWQRILLGEFDGPRTRSIRAQAWGV